VARLAATLVATSLILAGGSSSPVPGLFLLSSALVRYGVIGRMETSIRVPAVLGLVLGAGAAPALWWQTRQTRPPSSDSGAGRPGPAARLYA
jgi:uncharacterized protein